jgi:FkbM family methyltransferase
MNDQLGASSYTGKRASLAHRVAYDMLIRTAGITHPRALGDLWTRAWGVATPRFTGETKIHLHGSEVMVNAGYAYPAFSRRWPTYNAPLVEIVHQTSRHRGRPISVVDVGAAVGDTVVLLLERCPDEIGQFYCVEPDEEFFVYLTRNLGGRPEVELFQTMLSDTEELASDVVRIHSGTASPQGDRTREAVRLDSLLTHAQNIDVLKIDTDGFDGKILGGSTEILDQHQPSVIFEWHPTLLTATGQEWDRPFRVLGEHGYRWFVWFTKEGEFNHIDDGFDEGATSVLAALSQSDGAPNPDWHYDVVALTDNGAPGPLDIAALTHARKTSASGGR